MRETYGHDSPKKGLQRFGSVTRRSRLRKARKDGNDPGTLFVYGMDEGIIGSANAVNSQLLGPKFHFSSRLSVGQSVS